MTLISGPLSTVTAGPSAVSVVQVSVQGPRTVGTGVQTHESKNVAVSGGVFSHEIAPGPATLTMIVGKQPGPPIPILVDDVASQTLAQVIDAARLSTGETQESLAAFVQQVLAVRQEVLGAADDVATEKNAALSGIGTLRDSALGAINNARDGSLTQIGTARSGALNQIGQDSSSALADIGTAKSAALTEIDSEVQRAEDAADRAESAVNDGVGDGSVTVAKLAQDVKDQINSKADLVGGKVPTSQIPEVALTKPFSVTSRADLLALDAQEGDIGIITAGADKGSYILGAGASNVFSSWVQLAVSADSPVSSVNGQTGTVVLNAANVGAAPTTHTHSASQIMDAGPGIYVNNIVKRDGNGFFEVPPPTGPTHPTPRSYVDSRTFTIARQEVQGTNGPTIFEKRGNVVHVASTGTHTGVTIPADFRPAQTRRVVASKSATDANSVGTCTLNTDGSITGGWGAGSAFSYLIQ